MKDGDEMIDRLHELTRAHSIFITRDLDDETGEAAGTIEIGRRSQRADRKGASVPLAGRAMDALNNHAKEASPELQRAARGRR